MKIWKFFCGFLVIIIFIIAIFLIADDNYKILVVQSGSMRPSIKTGSLVIVRQSDNYKIGDIITFYGFENLKESTTHRIYNIEVAGNNIFYITKGDDNNRQDKNKVVKDNIIGKVIFNIPYIGYLINFIKTPIGFGLIIIAGLIIIINEIRKIKNNLSS